MQYLLVPVIMILAIGGTIGLLKLIQKFFPNSSKSADRAQEWIEKHPSAATNNHPDTQK